MMSQRRHACGRGGDTYTSVSRAWSLATLEKWASRMVTVPVRATWPHPQNRATPEKQRIVATSEAYGTPPRHLMQHSKQPTMRNRDRFHCKGHDPGSDRRAWKAPIQRVRGSLPMRTNQWEHSDPDGCGSWDVFWGSVEQPCYNIPTFSFSNRLGQECMSCFALSNSCHICKSVIPLPQNLFPLLKLRQKFTVKSLIYCFFLYFHLLMKVSRGL